MSTINYPSWWPTAPFTAKAQWLVSSHHVKTFSEACAQIGRRKGDGVGRSKVSVTEYQARLDRMKLS